MSKVSASVTEDEANMQLGDNAINDLNRLAAWLAPDELTGEAALRPELLILAGHAVLPAIFGALTLAQSGNIPVLFSGGTGHSTLLLQQAMRNNRLTAHLNTQELSEAQMLVKIALEVFHLPEEQLTVEVNSANCGENAAFSADLLIKTHSVPAQCLLVQDPLMQRRTGETFAFAWSQRSLNTHFINWPVFVPRLVSIAGKTVITGAQLPGIWEPGRYVSMILGEMKRLNNDENGYGPAGAGFIGAVAIPPDVRAAWERLRADDGLNTPIR
ncbi:ElyC/SanA/YdcF family protein [Erwinia sp. 9145]|uniref:ElyC/SanA/YdcF family protein n=1 Tax=Erwinia sp. 9145 TaxID=1500895 RepID=UPI000B0B2F1F|nr:ElyC/SanA/YdcF family protein [Erwinia sp. 9145]